MESQQYDHNDSGDSTPRSREFDYATADEPPLPVPRVRLMCSYAGRIQPRPLNHHLSYVGGETKILTVLRSITFKPILARIAAFLSPAPTAEDVCFKYQIPGEDLDALISVTNDEDLEHMMLEYDRLLHPGGAAHRLRLFVFLRGGNAAAVAPAHKSDRQWFVDALNSVSPPIPPPSPQVKDPPPIGGLAAEIQKLHIAAENQQHQAQIQDLQIASDNQQQKEHIQDRQRRQTQIQELQKLHTTAESQHQQAQIHEQQRVLQIAAVNQHQHAQIQEQRRVLYIATENQHQQAQFQEVQRMQIATENQHQQAQITEQQRVLQIATDNQHQQAQFQEVQRMQIATENQHQQTQITEQQRVLHIATENQHQQAQFQELQRMQIASENQQFAAENQQQQAQIQELQRLHIAAENQQPRRAWQEKAPKPMPPPPQPTWSEQRASPLVASRYASVAGGDQPMYGPGAYYPAVPRMVTAEAYRDATAAAMYSMSPPPQQPSAEGRTIARGRRFT